MTRVIFFTLTTNFYFPFPRKEINQAINGSLFIWLHKTSSSWEGALPYFGILQSRKGNSFDESLTKPGLGWPQVFKIELLAPHSLRSLLEFFGLLEYGPTTPLPFFCPYSSLHLRSLLLDLKVMKKQWPLFSAHVGAHAGHVGCSHCLPFARLLPCCFLGSRLSSHPHHDGPPQQIYVLSFLH